MRVADAACPPAGPLEAEAGGEPLSPMHPPGAYSPPGLECPAPSDLHPFLRELEGEHAALLEGLTALEEAIGSVRQTGFTRSLESALIAFCRSLDRDFIPHSRREETLLFPLLRARLIASGEHGRGKIATTSVDIMEDDHVTIVRLGAVVGNFLAVASRLADAGSALIVRDAALRNAGCLVERLRLHIFREDHIVFPSAHRLIAADEFHRMPMMFQPR